MAFLEDKPLEVSSAFPPSPPSFPPSRFFSLSPRLIPLFLPLSPPLSLSLFPFSSPPPLDSFLPPPLSLYSALVLHMRLFSTGLSGGLFGSGTTGQTGLTGGGGGGGLFGQTPHSQGTSLFGGVSGTTGLGTVSVAGAPATSGLFQTPIQCKKGPIPSHSIVY